MADKREADLSYRIRPATYLVELTDLTRVPELQDYLKSWSIHPLREEIRPGSSGDIFLGQYLAADIHHLKRFFKNGNSTKPERKKPGGN